MLPQGCCPSGRGMGKLTQALGLLLPGFMMVLSVAIRKS
jgi:hypothetical protein